MATVLDGIRVLDLTQFTAGPLCAMILGDLGADVIKVERPGGEDGRRALPVVEDVSLYYALNARNKRSVTLNLNDPEGRRILKRLARRSDVVVESFRPGRLDRLGLGYADLRRVNRGLTLVSITGYGHTGPYRDRGGFDMIAQAVGGLMSLNGEPDDPPLKVATSVAAVFTGLNGALGVLAALRHRDRTGEGQWIDLALLDNVVAQIEADIPFYGLTGQTLPRTGNRRLYTTPSNAYRARDGYVYVASGNDANWRRLCAAIGRPELAEDPRFRTNHDRRANLKETDRAVQEWLGDRSVDEAVTTLTAAKVPCGPVNDIPAVFADPQIAAREMIATLTHPRLGSIPIPGQPLKLSQTPLRAGGELADPGQHNAEVYRELLGAGPRKLATWTAAGII
ncbi:MAG: CoA transferase [Chloroflexi bacterium]|nr:CoA transferase [Chloroflexota bacterium]